MKTFQLLAISFERAENYSGWKNNCFIRDNFSLSSLKAMQFNEDFPALPMEDFQYYYTLVFDLTSLQDAAEQLHYPELNRESLRLEMFFQFPLE